MRHSRLFFLLILLLSTATPSFAETVEWSSVAMACVPTASTLAEGRYVTTAGRVKFKKGKLGSISFICPISNKLRSGSYILKGYTTHSSDVARTDGQARITLRKSKKDAYLISNVLGSDVFRLILGTKYRTQESFPKQLTFDTNSFYYWVQLTLERNGVRGEAAIHGVELIRQ